MSEDNPHWNLFRLSLSKMKQIGSWSTHWGVTCSVQIDGLVYRDYVRAKVADFDPVNFKGRGICKRVEYVNVRGHNCSNCDVAWWQDNDQMLHHDSSSAQCGFYSSFGALDFTIPLTQSFDVLNLAEILPQTTGLVPTWNDICLKPRRQ